VTAAELQPYVHRCIACKTVFNALSGHSIRICAAVLTDQRKAA